MLGADDVAGCVERSLAWLAEHAGVSHAICALADVERGELIGVGGHRVTPAQIEKVTVGLGEMAEPWIQAMGSRAPRFFRGRPEEKSDRVRVDHPFGRSAYWAFPLGTSKVAGRPAEGLLLLVLSGEPTADHIFVWPHHPLVAHPRFQPPTLSAYCQSVLGQLDDGRVKAVGAGHLHCGYESRVGALTMYGCPSSWLVVDFDNDTLAPPAYRWFSLHDDGRIDSVVYSVDDPRYAERAPLPRFVMELMTGEMGLGSH